MVGTVIVPSHRLNMLCVHELMEAMAKANFMYVNSLYAQFYMW